MWGEFPLIPDHFYLSLLQVPMLEPSPSRGKVAPPQAVTDEGETHSFLYFTNQKIISLTIALFTKLSYNISLTSLHGSMTWQHGMDAA